LINTYQDSVVRSAFPAHGMDPTWAGRIHAVMLAEGLADVDTVVHARSWQGGTAGALLVVWLGFGSVPKICMVVLISIFPIVVATMSGLTSTPVELTELARSMSASRRQTFVKLRIPWALPQIFVGLKVAVTLAVVGAVVGEFAGGDQGLGYVIVASGASADTSLAFAAMTLLSAMSVILFYLVVTVERLLLPWAREITG
jgi:NitT/TauT family transport system permease protein